MEILLLPAFYTISFQQLCLLRTIVEFFMPALIFLGIFVLGLVLVDVLITTLTVGGGGPLTSRISCWVWQSALKIHRLRSSHRLLLITGWVILVGTALLWFLLTWVGWGLIFASSPLDLVSASSKEPASFFEKIYFVGYTLSTLGLGDFQPIGIGWQLATAVASASGFTLITLTIAYLLPLVAAASQKRQLAVYISSLGGTPDEIVARAWNGKDFGQFGQHLIAIAPQIVLQGEQHLTYPILHYFHNPERFRSLPLSLTALDDALTLILYGIPKSAQPDPSALGSVRRAITAYLKTLKAAYVEPVSEKPAAPPLELLRRQEIPTVSTEEFQAATQHLEQRRKLLLALIQEDGWTWDSIASSQTTNRATSLDEEKF